MPKIHLKSYFDRSILWHVFNVNFLTYTFCHTVVTPALLRPGLLYFAFFCQIFEEKWLKTLLNPEIGPDCYTFLTFFVTVRESLLYLF